jgi:ABC-type Fe3+-hydroxamate transport system substrate-binding protein
MNLKLFHEPNMNNSSENASTNAGELCSWLVADPKKIASEDPEIMMFEPSILGSFIEKELRVLRVERNWTSVSAVRNRGVFLTTARPLGLLAHHGPSFTTDALPWLRKIITSISGS